MTTETDLAPTGTTVPRQRASTAVTGGLTGAGLATLLLGAVLPPIDFFVVNVALPTIDRDLHASTATLELVVAGYGIAYAVLMVLGGRLGDAFGRRRLFLFGLASFTLTSLICGLAPTAGMLVAARVAQGAASALMVPQVLATIQATTTGERRSTALGRYGAMGGIGTVVGQLIGGVLVSANIAGTGWRPIFLVNVPVGIVGFILARRHVPDTRSPRPAGTDLAGTVLLAVALLALLIPVTEGRTLGWPAWTWASLALSPIAAVVFLLVERAIERRARTTGGPARLPLLPPSLLRTRSMRRGLGVAIPFFAGFGGFMFVYSLALQNGLRLGPLASGLALSPMAVGTVVVSMFSGRLVSRLGRLALPLGAVVQALGIALSLAAVWSGWNAYTALMLAPGMLVSGMGIGLAMSTIFRVVLADVPADRAGAGSGVLTTTQQGSLSLGAALLGSLFATLAAPHSMGIRGAFETVLAIQLAATVAIVALSLRLPDPRR